MTKVILITILSLGFVPVFGQEVAQPVEDFNVDFIIGIEEGIFSSLLFIVTLLSNFIPGLKNFESKHVRALAVALALIVGMVTYHKVSGDDFSVGQLVNYVIMYILTGSVYDKVLKPLGVKTKGVEKKVD